MYTGLLEVEMTVDTIALIVTIAAGFIGVLLQHRYLHEEMMDLLHRQHEEMMNLMYTQQVELSKL